MPARKKDLFDFFEHLGIELQRQKIIVVKMGYLVPDLKQVGSHTFMALSPGAVHQVIDHLSFKRICRPIFPLDSNFYWKPQVANGDNPICFAVNVII